jgi:hypothetical protein
MVRVLFALLVAVTSAFGVVSTPTNLIQYTGNGSTATYSVPWRFFQNADLVVQETSPSGVVTPIVLNVDYTVSGAGLPAGGSITLTAGNLAAGTILTILRDPSQVQQTSLPNGSPYFGSTIEAALDLLTMQVQGTRKHVNNAIQIPLSESGAGYNLQLPTAPNRANKVIGFDALGNVIMTAGGGGGGGGGGSGTVTSVGLTAPAELTVGGSPVTTAGNLSLTWASASGRKFIASPADGTTGAYAGRAITAADLPSTGVSAGSYTNANITVNAQGQITSASNGSGGGSASVEYLPVVAATSSDTNISAPGATIDGVTMSSGQRVLLANQLTPTQSGLWVWNGASSAMTRPADYANGSSTMAAPGYHVRVQNGGTANGGTDWYIWSPSTGAITIGSTNVTFKPFDLKVGSTSPITGVVPIANGGTNSSTALSGSSIMVSNGSSVVQGPAGTTSTVLHGNASGTPTYGAVNVASEVTGTLPVANGGTGATTLTGYLKGNGTSAFSAVAAIPVSDVTLTGLVEFQSGMIELPAAKTYTLIGSVPYGIVIDDVRIGTFGGTLTANFQINGVSITGLSSIAVTSTRSTYAASAANSANAGTTVTMIVTSPSSANDLDFTMKWHRQ